MKAATTIFACAMAISFRVSANPLLIMMEQGIEKNTADVSDVKRVLGNYNDSIRSGAPHAILKKDGNVSSEIYSTQDKANAERYLAAQDSGAKLKYNEPRHLKSDGSTKLAEKEIREKIDCINRSVSRIESLAAQP